MEKNWYLVLFQKNQEMLHVAIYFLLHIFALSIFSVFNSFALGSYSCLVLILVFAIFFKINFIFFYI